MAGLIRDRYEPLEVLGRGGEGTVLHALDHQHDRHVAIKVRPVPSGERRPALLAEARLLLGARPHPSLPLLREDFFDGERYYLVMDWIEGKSLARVLQERGNRGLSAWTVLRYLTRVARALDHLHGHDPAIVHQDVKPANVILTPEGRVTLVDFGISRREGERDGATRGTRGYVAPEVARGGPPASASDVYGLAATALELLVGRLPGHASDWCALPPETVRAIERAIRPALSVDPARRPGSAGELVEELRDALDPPGATPAMRFERVAPSGRSRVSTDLPRLSVAALRTGSRGGRPLRRVPCSRPASRAAGGG